VVVFLAMNRTVTRRPLVIVWYNLGVSQPVADDRSVVRITDRAQAVVLLDRRYVRFLRPFMAIGRSVGEAAAELEMTVSFLLPRVRRFERLGLLEVVETRARKGRPIKVYRAVGDEFFVPLSTLEIADVGIHEASLTELLLASMVELFETYADLVPEPGFRIERGSSQVRLRGAMDADHSIDLRDPAVPAVVNEWRWPRVSPQRAKRLQVDLLDAIDHAVADSDPADAAYLVNVRMAPVGKRVDSSPIE
jgi:hypothetical protein